MTADDASGTVRSVDETMMMILGNDDMMIRSARRFEPRRGRRDDGDKSAGGYFASEEERGVGNLGGFMRHAIARVRHRSQSQNNSCVHDEHPPNSLSFLPSWRFAKGRARHFDWSILESFCREMAAFRRRGGDDETAPDKLSRHVDRIRDHSDAALDTMGCGASAPVSAATPVEKAPESSTGTTRAPSLPRRDHFAPSTCLIRAPTDASLTDTPLPTPRHPPSSLAGRKASDEDKPWKRAPKKTPSKVRVVPAESLLADNLDDDGPPQVSLVVASVSRAGAEPSTKRPNQDACAAHPRDFATTSGAFFSVLDGHGPHGHHVARLARERIPGWLVEDPKRRALLREDPSAALRRAFVAVDAELTESGIDVQLSGAAVVVCHVRGRRLTTAWVGDCRAVLGRESDGVLSAVALTRDHTPDDAGERARIEKMGGRVAAMLDGLDDDGKPLEVGPLRVWQSRAWVPGLAHVAIGWATLTARAPAWWRTVRRRTEARRRGRSVASSSRAMGSGNTCPTTRRS